MNLKGKTYNGNYFSTIIQRLCKSIYPYSDAIINAGINSGIEFSERDEEFHIHNNKLRSASKTFDKVMEMNESHAIAWIEKHKQLGY